MRPPLRVEAKVAEELRNWLTSELERLDASNTDPFAHHVVTILLQEDAEIEDEPLSSDNNLDQWGFNTVRRNKPKDKRIKAAVQFLTKAIASEEPDESEIELIVNELMTRIEATKLKLKARRSHGRDLLGALTVNTESQPQQSHVNVERSYNEVFPSLPGETASSKSSLVPQISPNDSVWTRSPPGKENNCQVRVKKLPQSLPRKFRFANKYEAAAYMTAAHVCAFTLAETANLPQPESMEVPTLRSLAWSVADRYGHCWKSAFKPRKTTKAFSPSIIPLPVPEKSAPAPNLPQKKPVYIIKKGHSKNHKEILTIANDLSKYVNLLDPASQKVFLPPEPFLPTIPRPSSVLHYPPSTDPDDLEVQSLSTSGLINQKLRGKKKGPKPKLPADEKPLTSSDNIDEIQGVLTFPDHFGSYWDDMIKNGVTTMYPNLKTPVPHSQSNDTLPMPPESWRNVNVPQLPDATTYDISKEWASVVFTDNVCKYAMNQICSDTQGHKYDRWGTHEYGYSYENGDTSVELCDCHGGLLEAPDESNEKHSLLDDNGGVEFDESLRAINPSSDSGILLQAAAERNSLTPSEASLSAPAAFRLPPRAWPLEKSNGSHKMALDSNLKGNQHYNRSEDALKSKSLIDAQGNNFPCKDKQVAGAFHSSMDKGDFASFWDSPLREPSWDHILQSIFPPSGDYFSGLTIPDKTCLIASDNGSTPSTISLTVTPCSQTQADFAPSPTISSSERSTHYELILSAAHLPKIPENEETVAAAPLSTSSPAVFPLSVSRYFMPSSLSPGKGMDNDVAHALQSAYVNSIFSNNIPSENMPETVSNAVCCSDLESAWLAHKDSGLNKKVACPQPAAETSTGIVKGRTCSKWLENDCTLGDSCPFSHPSL